MTETYTPKTNLPLDAIVKSTPLDGIQQSFRVDSYDRVDNRGIEISVATGHTPEEINLKVTNGDNSPIVEAKNAVGDVVGDTVTQAINSGQEQGAAAEAILATQEKKAGMDAFSDFIIEDALTVDDPNYNPRFANLMRNQQIAFEVMAERFKGAQEKGVVGTALDFVDRYLLRQIGIGTYEDITRRSERKGLELAQAAASMGGDEYREYIEAYADELAEEGIFRGDNWFAYQDGLNEAVNAGLDPNAGLNQIMGVTDLLGLAALKAPLRGTAKVITRVGKIKGVKAADEAVERLSEVGARSHPEVQDEMMAGAQSITKDETMVGATQSRTNKLFETNRLVREVQELAKVGSFGRMATQASIDGLAQQVSARLAKISSRPLADYNVIDRTGFGDMAVQVKAGKLADGTPYKYRGTAQNEATAMQEKSGLATQVIPVDADDLNKGFYIQIEEAMDLSRTADAVDVANVTENILAKALGSARAVDDVRLNTLANMAESGQGAIRERVMRYLKPLEKLKYDSKVALGKVLRELRDGQDSHIREAYSEADFRAKFKLAHPKKLDATDKDLDAYYAAITLNDTAYVLQANRLASRYVAKGYKSIGVEGGNVPAKRITEALPDDTRILDGNTGRAIWSQDVDEGFAVFRLDRELEGGVEYVVRPKNVRSIQYEDVLSYNAGGRRTNVEAKYFATTKKNRALFTALSEKQVLSGVADINALMRAIRASGKKIDELTNELDGLIPSHNKWNTNIEDTAGFVAFLSKKGIDTADDISYKARDGVVEGAGDLYNGMGMAEYQIATTRRSDDVIMEYGGKETFNENPVKAMVDQLSEASAEYSFRNYNYNAKTAWLKKALRVDTLPEGTDVNQLFRETEVTGAGATDRKLRTLRGIIERRESLSSPAVGAMQDFGRKVEEYVFDNAGKSFKTGGLEGALLKIGFQSAFGFLNVSQFLLQASHAASIIAISPKAGGEAASLVLAMRAVMHSGSKATKKLAYERFAKISSLSADDLAEYETYLRTSGRDLVENDAIEKGTGAGFGISWWEGSSTLPQGAQKAAGGVAGVGKKALDIGLKPFNEGERLSRHTGIMTAFIEHKRLYPKVSALSDEGRAWITRREQDLTLNMTTASRGAWQSGLLKVPTQWMSYSMRFMEAMTPRGGLKPAERARLAGMMMIMSGTTGLGVTSVSNKVADYIGEAFGVEPDSVAYTALKYGVLDGVGSWGLSAMSGEEVRSAFGSRIAPLTMFSDLYRKVTEESLLTTIAGPSGEIAGGAASAGISALMGGYDLIVNGDGYGREYFMKDFTRVMRTASGIDNWYKAREIMMTGVYRSKNGTTLPMEFTDAEAAMQALGVTNFKVAEYYARSGEIWRSEKKVREFQKGLQSDFRLALAKYERDPVAGRRFMDEIAARIEFSGFSPLVKSQLRRNLARAEGNGVADMALKLIGEGRDYGASVIERLN